MGSKRVPLNLAMSLSKFRQLGALMWNGGHRPYGSAMTLGITPSKGLRDEVIAGVPKPRAMRIYQPPETETLGTEHPNLHNPDRSSASRYCVFDMISTPFVDETGEPAFESSTDSRADDAIDSGRGAWGVGAGREGTANVVAVGELSPRDCERPRDVP